MTIPFVQERVKILDTIIPLIHQGIYEGEVDGYTWAISTNYAGEMRVEMQPIINVTNNL